MKGLHIFGLSHSYGSKRVLNHVGLMIPAGELVCLLGPSGSGKSTLLRLAAGLERVQEGNVVIDEVTVGTADLHVAPEHRRVGLMFQDYALFPHLTVMQNVCFGLFSLSADAARARAMEMLEQVGMESYADSHPHMLSGGQQQRIALARALAPEPRLLLLDEPFSGLDTSMRESIREEMLAVLKRNGVATMMVTHDPEEAMYMADRIKIIGANGRILQSGRPHEIYYHPTHEFVARMFGKVNRFEGTVAKGRIDTPLGAVACDLAEGSRAQVLVRPEGIVLESPGGATSPGPAVRAVSSGAGGGEGAGGTPVEVISTRLLGHDNIVRVRLAGDPDNELLVRVHHAFEAELQSAITARLDPEYAFAYALDGTAGMAASPSDVEAAAAE